MDCSLPGSSIHGIFQARVLEWVAISFSRGSSRLRDWTQVSHIAGRRFYPLSHQGSPGFNSWVGKIHWRRDRLPTPIFLDFPCGSNGKESTCNVENLGSIPGERKGYPLRYSGLENFMDCIVHGVAKSQTWLSNFHSLTCSKAFCHLLKSTKTYKLMRYHNILPSTETWLKEGKKSLNKQKH